MKMESLIGILGTLAGVTLGGLISYFTSSRQREHEKQLISSKRQIEKVEAAHEVLTKIGIIYRTLHTNSSFLIAGRKSEETKTERLPFEELEMLFSFYVPELEEKANDLVKVCQEYGASMVRAIVFTPDTDGERRVLWDELNNKYSNIEGQINELKKLLSMAIKKYA